ncbi:hypothetical protein HGRIS_007046 [Hohenbuehelia grisea]|uniref:Glucose-methanol-choline oxidoreductase N-terminal domain-containing protein n=1 Tax=Hohenbuehelia grisea TaxID=104357 RepID=A0ABR3JB96_9AGAR
MSATLENITGHSFDYVVIGAGTSGLTLAARLTEDPNITVVVLEAGEPNLDDPKILIPSQLGATFGNPKYDWAFLTTPQPNVAGRQLLWSRGKGLGGSSAMNFYAWSKPAADDIDAFERLGNKGWNWLEFEKYSKRIENFHPPIAEFSKVSDSAPEPNTRNTDGTIEITTPFNYHSVEELFQQSLAEKGFQWITDPYAGKVTGRSMFSSNLDPKAWTRSYAATGYYLPNRDRPNLKVLTEAIVSRVLFDKAHSGPNAVATGVEFLNDGALHVVHARKEVILSAGAIKSPQILELSGIGRRDILEAIDIPLQVELPGVGENVQEHVCFAVTFEVHPDVKHETHDRMRDPAYAAEALRLHSLGQGPHRLGFGTLLFAPFSQIAGDERAVLVNRLVENIEKRKNAGNIPPGLAEQWDMQLAALQDDTLPDAEVALYPGFFGFSSTPESEKRYISLMYFLNRPFSRGTIHAKTRDPTAQPEIDPRYFDIDFDLEVLVQEIKFGRSLFDVEPWKSDILREVDPGPKAATDDQLRDYIKAQLGTTYHTAGSCSMLPLEKQGVVDPSLKVYGTANVRVADISIIPLHIAAHTQATAYVIGEKAADLIRSGE